jgi:hypothetical protein
MQNKLSRSVVVIPLYKNSMTHSEKFAFQNTLSILADHDICIICPPKISNFIADIQLKYHQKFDVEYFPNKYFSGISGYNKLLMTACFYKRFIKYEYMLIVQTDAIVFSDSLDDFCNSGFSYIGAPWLKDSSKLKLELSFVGVGNGGFSLRKIPDFIAVLSRIKYLSYPDTSYLDNIYGKKGLRKFIKRFIFSFTHAPFQPILNEDIFWGMLVPENFKFFTVPTPEEAIPFAFEVAPEYLYELNGKNLPFGCHAWEKYNKEFWLNFIHAKYFSPSSKT